MFSRRLVKTIGGEVVGKCTDDCTCMGVCIYWLEDNEKDTAGKFQTVSSIRIINLCFDHMVCNSLFISGLSASNKGIATSKLS